MNHKLLGRLAGIAFIIGTVCGVLSLNFIAVMKENDFLYLISKDPDSLLIGGVLVMIMAIACASIAYWIYPVLSKRYQALAVASVGFRTIESCLALVSATLIISLAYLGKDFGVRGDLMNEATANTLRSLVDGLGPTIGITFSVGALMYYLGFYKMRLIPRFIALWGIVGVILHITGYMFYFFAGVEIFSTTGMFFHMPIALQEMVFAVYLVLFGFRDVEVAT